MPPIPNPMMQRTILIIRSLPAPFLRKTAIGGRKIDNRISTRLIVLLSRELLAKVKARSVRNALNASKAQHATLLGVL